MKILNNDQIDQKITRLAFEIYEENFLVKELYFLGINNNGYTFAEILQKKYDEVSNKTSKLGRLSLNPAQPLESEVNLDLSQSLSRKNLVVVDDVANTGRTLFYAMKPLLNFVPKKIETVVLVDRKHKTFPVKSDYVGLSLATTLKENIRVDISKKTQKAAFLE